MSRYDHLDREALIRLLQRRDAERAAFGLATPLKSEPKENA